MIQQFKLIEKKNLTHNVFEMIFEGENKLDEKFISGQFVTFLIEQIGGRAYSILDIEGNKIILIIKKRELNEGGRGGSKYLCELEVGDQVKGVGPAGHFVLQENNKNKLFIGTGTGLVPLYNQILGALEKKLDCKIKLLFGAREEKDLFYVKELNKLKEENSNFDFDIYLSAENILKYNKGYTTNYLTKENLAKYEEFYICGAPAMIDCAVEKIKSNGVEEGCLFYEKY